MKILVLVLSLLFFACSGGEEWPEPLDASGVEPPIQMRYLWDGSRSPKVAKKVCVEGCEARGLEFLAISKADNETGWRCLCEEG